MGQTADLSQDCGYKACTQFLNQPLFFPALQSFSGPSHCLSPTTSQRTRKPKRALPKNQPPGARAEWTLKGPGPHPTHPCYPCLTLLPGKHSLPILGCPTWETFVMGSCPATLLFIPTCGKSEATLMSPPPWSLPSTSPRSNLSALWVITIPLLKISIITSEHVFYLGVYLSLIFMYLFTVCFSLEYKLHENRDFVCLIYSLSPGQRTVHNL